MPKPPESTRSDLDDALDQVTRLNERVVETCSSSGDRRTDRARAR
jgi:hypothetical protein